MPYAHDAAVGGQSSDKALIDERNSSRSVQKETLDSCFIPPGKDADPKIVLDGFTCLSCYWSAAFVEHTDGVWCQLFDREADGVCQDFTYEPGTDEVDRG